MGAGYRTMSMWDALGVGKDASVDVSDAMGGRYAYAGLPEPASWWKGRFKVFENRGFAVGYSESYRNPVWSAYHLFPSENKRAPKRPSRFSVDHRTRSKVRHEDYTHSGFDRGHLAPNYGIATRYGREAQLETFLMSNIIPQTPAVNRGIWRELEMLTARRYSVYFDEVWIISGPIFGSDFKRMESDVAIPEAYYKIVADEDEGRLRVMAFIIEADCPPYTRFRQRLTSVDAIEEQTGLDFFTRLPDEQEATLESQTPTRLWPWIWSVFQTFTEKE